MLGIIGAMDKEMDALFAQMEGASPSRIGYSRYAEGLLAGVPVVISRCGPGKVNAAACAQAMLMRWQPEAVINIGVAGALMDALNVTDAVIASSCVQHDVDTSAVGDPKGMVSGVNMIHFPCDEVIREMLTEAADEEGLTHTAMAIATGDRFVEKPEEKRLIAAEFGAAACDMEGGAIAQVCVEMGVPFAAYRTISDTVEGTGQEYLLTARMAAEASGKLLHRFLKKWKKA